MKVPVMITAEELVRQLWPGLNAVAAASIRAVFAEEVKKHLERWLDVTLGSGALKSARNENGKLTLLIEFDVDNLFGKETE